MKGIKALITTTIGLSLYSIGSLASSLDAHFPKKLSYKQMATLTGSLAGGTFSDGFGQVIYFNNNKLFIDAFLAMPDNEVAEGAVYVYENTNNQWVLKQTITTNGNLDHFGAVGIKAMGDWLFIPVIGTPSGKQQNDANANQDFKGSLQIYQLNAATGQYVFSQSLDNTTVPKLNLAGCDPAVVSSPNPPPANTVEQGAAFGLSFDVLPALNLLVVGAATQMNGSLINSGQVFVFKYQNNQWQLIQTLTNPDGMSANDTFGGVVRADTGLLAISNSAQFTDVHLDPYPNTSVYFYKYNLLNSQFEFVQKIHGDQTNKTPYPASASLGSNAIADNFGANLSFNAGNLLISAPFENLGSQSPLGAAYLYQVQLTANGPRLVFQKKFVSDDPTSLFFSWGLAVGIDHAYIGDPAHTGPAPGNNRAQGAVLVFKNTAGTWGYETTLFDANGAAYDLLGSAVGNTLGYIGAGTAKGVPVLFLDFLPFPALINIPFPVNTDKAVIWAKSLVKEVA